MNKPAGVVAELWRYPVKSMLGERLDRVDLTHRGVEGDRVYAVRDGEGKFGSGKNTRRFRLIEGLFGFSAHYAGTVPVVTFPSGEQIRGDDPRFGEELRNALSRDDVDLAREEAISHFDDSPAHLVTDAALSWLGDAVDGVDARRFRPNFVIATGLPPGQPERAWVGRRARVGGIAVLEFTHRTERCVMVNNAQYNLAHSSHILRTLSALNDMEFGVYARVITEGPVQVGDELHLLG
jgi:uncharacterized protein